MQSLHHLLVLDNTDLTQSCFRTTSLVRNWNVVPTAGSQMIEPWPGAAGAIKLIRTKGTILSVLHGSVNNRSKTLRENFGLPCLKALVSWDSSSSGVHLLILFVVKINTEKLTQAIETSKGL